VAVANYDEELSLCEIVDETFFFNETKGVPCKVFSNRYMKYIINGGELVEAQLFASFIRQPSALELLVRELLRSLYLLLLFGVGPWLYEKYYYYAGIILFTSSVAIIVNLVQMVQLNTKIFHMDYYEVKVYYALRQGGVTEVSSLDLVPGDVVFLENPIKITFEGVILEGSALIN
jgi:magnesium-transporting ATPase (P-type)